MHENEAATPQGGKSYVIGDVGPGARVAQGENNTLIELAFAQVPGGDDLAREFGALLERIRQASDLDDDTRELAVNKTETVAKGLAEAHQNPTKLRLALMEAKGTLATFAGWTWTGLSDILKSEAAQKTIGTITEAGTKAAIGSLIQGA